MPTFQSSPLNPAISWLFLGYFLVLFAERVQSLARICRTSFAALYRTGFDGFVDTLTVLSLVATVLLLAFGCKGYWQSLVNPAVIPDYSMLTVTAGVMLVSGMMHTEYTVAPVQFVSYGMLIIAMALRTVQTAAGADHATLFHVIEAIVALALVACFTWMLRDLFLGQGHDLLRWVPMLIAAVGDAVILAMRWKENVNTFVLLFVILSAVVFAVGKVLFAAQLL